MALNQDDPNVVFLLFGPSRSGKSSTGNLLLNKNTFSEKNTVRCTTGQERNGRRIIRVVDTSPTPVFSHETDTILHTNREITRSLLLSVYGPRNIIVVLKTDQLPRETAGCIQFLQMMLGNDAMSDINIVFTGTSIINDAAFDMFLNKLVAYPDVRRIIAKCKGKHLALNDGDSKETNRRKVEQLLLTAKPIDKERKEIQLVMTGQSHGGKSKTANNILGENVFTNGTETLGCTVARRSVHGRDVIVVDTPGMNSRVMDNDAILNDLKDPTLSLNAPPRIIVPVLRMDRQELSDEERNVLTILQETFPNQITRRLVIIFTREEEYLKRANSSFDTFLRTSPPELKALLKRSHYRCKGFNNMADITGEENKRQVGALLRMIDDANSDLRLVLIGKTGSGKSSTGNTVLGRRGVFAFASAMTSITHRCKSAKGNTNSRNFEIVDTPGLFDTRPEDTTTILLEMARCLTMTVPGPHAFLLVLSISDRYTEESKNCIDIIRRLFGDEMLRHTVIIFTNADSLDPAQTPENVIRASDISLRSTLEQNNNRWLAFNNKAPTGDEPEKVMEAVELMLACNEGRHYSSAIYTQVATRLRAYGAGNFADMRAFAYNHPRVMLSIVSLLAGGSSLFGFGYLAIGTTAASGFVMTTYERLMGRNL